MSINNAGDIQLGLKIDSKGFNKQMSGMQKLAKKAGVALAAAFSVKAIATFGKQCLELGSDLEEVQNVVDTVFPTMNEQVNKFAQNAAASYGLSETMAKRYAGTFGAMADAFGFAENESYAMATALTGLAGDVASFYNITQDEAYTKLKSVFTGETESLKDLGVVMTQTALDQYALANGFGKTTAAMTEQEKVALRYAFVQDQLSNAAGDFAKTSGSWANQVRYLSLQMESFKATIGQGLINVLTPVIQWLNVLMGKLVSVANAFKKFTETLTGKKSQPVSLKKASEGVNSVTEGANGATDALNKTVKSAKKLKRELAGFDQITKLGQPSTDSGTSGPNGGGSSARTAIAETPTKETPKSVEKLTEKYKVLGKAVDRLKKSFKGFTDVIGSGLKWGYDNILKPLGKWTMQKLAPKLIEALASAFDLLSVAFKTAAPVFKTIWDALGKPLAKLAGSAAEKFLGVLTKAFTGLAKAIEKHPELFQGILTTIIGLKVISSVTGKVNKFRVTMLNAGSAAKGLGAAFPKIAKLAKGAGGILKAIFTPKSLIVLGIMAAVTAGILLYKNWDKIKKVAKKIGNAIMKPFKAIGNFFKKTWKKTLEKGSEVVENMRDRVKSVVDGLKTYFGGWIEFITGVFSGNWEKAWEGIKNIFGGFWDTITSALNLPDIDVIAKLSAIKDAAFDKVSEAWHAIKDKAVELLANAKEKVAGALETLKGKWDSIKDRAAELKAEAKETVVGAIDALKGKWETITTKTATLTAEAKEAVEGALNNLKGAWDTIKKKSVTLTAKAENKSKNTLKALKDSWATIKSKTVTLTAKVKASVTNLKKWINDKIIGKLNDKLVKTGLWKKGPIPMLAQGGYVKKNTPQLAMIGDNRHQGEVVAPERKLEEMALRAASMAGGGVTPELIAILKEILNVLNALDLNVYLDGKQVKKRIVDLINANTKATGVCEIIV